MDDLSGHFDLGYSYQNQVLAVFPPKVMGSFDMCQSPKVYSFDAVQTHYCALGTDVSQPAPHDHYGPC